MYPPAWLMHDTLLTWGNRWSRPCEDRDKNTACAGVCIDLFKNWAQTLISPLVYICAVKHQLCMAANHLFRKGICERQQLVSLCNVSGACELLLVKGFRLQTEVITGGLWRLGVTQKGLLVIQSNQYKNISVTILQPSPRLAFAFWVIFTYLTNID